MRARKFGLTGVFGSVLFLGLVVMVIVAYLTRKTDGYVRAPATASDPRPSRPITLKELDETFFQALKSHPRREISEDLYIAIADRSIAYSFEVQNTGANATFTVFSGAEVIPPRDPAVLIPAFHVKPQLVIAAESDPDALHWLQTVVYHEYQHYLQWKSADGDVRDIHRSNGGGRIMKAEDCRTIWQNEHAAYLAECGLVKDMGWKTENLALCEKYGDPARFQTFLLQQMISYMPDMKLDQCVPVLQELLGRVAVSPQK